MGRAASKTSYPTAARIKRMADAVRSAGFAIERVRVSPDGSIDFMPAKDSAPISAYDAWKASRER